MKSEIRSGTRNEGRGAKSPREKSEERKADERKEALVLMAIAILFLANVVLYLCHHYGLTSLNEQRPVPEARVMVD
jgi:hypothetical protein